MAEILLSGTASGGSSIGIGHEDDSGVPVLLKEYYGQATGGSSLALSMPERLEGYGRLMGTLEVLCTPQRQRAPKCYRWGHQFGPGDLEYCVSEGGSAACMVFTLFQIQSGCVPKQVGPKERKPGRASLGTYYATGTAGECGQPGLWMIRWCYRKSFGSPALYVDCYFYVLDSVLCPVAGDTLPRVRKWGWE